MGVKLEIAGISYDVEDYSVTEESTPLSLDDTAQSTGTMEAAIRIPEEFSPFRKLQVELESNPIHDPIATVSQISYDPTQYSVSGVDGEVHIERIAGGDGWFLVGTPELAVERVFTRFQGSGRAMFSSTPRPPQNPDTIPNTGWVTIPEGISIIPTSGRSSDYPGMGAVAIRLESTGDWVTVSRRSPRSDTLTGDSPNYRSPTRRLETKWRNDRNASPSVSTWKYLAGQSTDLVSQLGLSMLRGAKYRLTDSNKGVTSGTISDVSFTPGGLVRISGVTDLDQLNSYNVVARPTNLSDYPGFNGTLGEAVRYYAALSGVSYIWVHPDVENIPVSYPGWEGETWFHLKQLATVHGCELSFVSGFPVFRPIRGRVTEPGRWLSKSHSLSQPNLALSVEGYNQSLRDIRNEYVVHPDIGDDTVLSAVPGEIAEFTLDITASVYRLTSVSAVFTRENGQSISWQQAGATVTINPENSRQLLVKLAPPPTLLTERVYIGFLRREERVPGLYVRADGVAFEPEKVTYTTGVPENLTGTRVGVTLDSPFLSDSETTGSALTRVASQRSSTRFSLSGSVTNVNRRGDSGVPDFVSYQEAQSYLESLMGPDFTYEDLRVYMSALERGDTYADLQSLFSTENSTDYRFQEFGNVAGSRVWDEDSRRWYRIRSATITPFDIQNIQADDDLLLQEFLQPWEDAGLTYGDVQDSLPEGGPADVPFLDGSVKISYGQLQLMGVPRV